MRGGIDGFIRQYDTEVRVHNKGQRRSGRGQMDDCNEGEDGETRRVTEGKDGVEEQDTLRLEKG